MTSDDHLFPVSPELALVDPELAARARERLPVRVGALATSGAEARSLRLTEDDPRGMPARTAPLAASKRSETHRRARSWALLAGTAAAVIVSLLLLDVQVEVGKNPASAESQTPELGQPAPPSVPPASVASPPPRRPAATPPAPALQARRFAWAPVKGASGYRVEIRRGSTRIFVRETTRPEVTVPPTWKSGEVRHGLRPGEYRWYVWPIVSGRRSARAVVQASLLIPAS